MPSMVSVAAKPVPVITTTPPIGELVGAILRMMGGVPAVVVVEIPPLKAAQWDGPNTLSIARVDGPKYPVPCKANRCQNISCVFFLK